MLGWYPGRPVPSGGGKALFWAVVIAVGAVAPLALLSWWWAR